MTRARLPARSAAGEPVPSVITTAKPGLGATHSQVVELWSCGEIRARQGAECSNVPASPKLVAPLAGPNSSVPAKSEPGHVAITAERRINESHRPGAGRQPNPLPLVGGHGRLDRLGRHDSAQVRPNRG